MLRLRVITALILAGGLGLTLAFASYPLQACIFALVATAGAWEWATLAGARSNWYRGAFAVGIPLLCFVLWSAVGLPDMGVLLPLSLSWPPVRFCGQSCCWASSTIPLARNLAARHCPRFLGFGDLVVHLASGCDLFDHEQWCFRGVRDDPDGRCS